jgi:hypothetical protein
MSTQPAVSRLPATPKALETTGLTDVAAPLDELTEKRLDEIEMIGEEEAAGFSSLPHSEVTAGMRYLHSSRTIHQLVTDRNRAVGLYLAVASLLWTGSGAMLTAKPEAALLVPIGVIQRWCLPVTFGTLAVLAVFTGFILIRTRIGLIYEVAKMNALLGLPVGRVRRLGFLSIFFIMHLLVSLAGGVSGALFTHHLLYGRLAPDGHPAIVAALAGVVISTVVVLLYIFTVLYTSADRKLIDAQK